MNTDKDKNGNILKVSRLDQYRTVEELLEKSEPNSVYYTLLILSTCIIAAGLILGNAAIVIGGMLVTPVLTPILVIALGISTGQTKVIRYSISLVGKSFLFILLISFIFAILFGKPTGNVYLFSDSVRTGMLYFIVAFVSGIAATFAWARKETSEILPGIAVAVSLVPPLSLLGIGLGIFGIDLMRSSFLIFISNFVGVILGSMVVFSLLKFYKTGSRLRREVKAS